MSPVPKLAYHPMKSPFIKSNFIKFFSLLGAALGSISLIYLLYFSLNAERPPSHSDEALFTFTPPDKILILKNSEHLTLVSKGDKWFSQNTGQNTGSNERIRHKSVKHLLSMLTTMGQQPPQSAQTETVLNRATLGLDPPQFKITLFYNHTKLELSLSDSPTSTNKVYLAVSGRPEVFLVSSQVHQLLGSNGLSRLYDRRLATFETDDVEHFKSTGTHCRSVEFRRDGDKWTITNGTLTTTAIELFLDEITNLVGQEPLADTGLTNHPSPWCVLEFTGRDRRKEILTIFSPLSALPGVSAACLQQLPNNDTKEASPCYKVLSAELDILKK